MFSFMASSGTERKVWLEWYERTYTEYYKWIVGQYKLQPNKESMTVQASHSWTSRRLRIFYSVCML